MGAQVDMVKRLYTAELDGVVLVEGSNVGTVMGVFEARVTAGVRDGEFTWDEIADEYASVTTGFRGIVPTDFRSQVDGGLDYAALTNVSRGPVELNAWPIFMGHTRPLVTVVSRGPAGDSQFLARV